MRSQHRCANNPRIATASLASCEIAKLAGMGFKGVAGTMLRCLLAVELPLRPLPSYCWLSSSSRSLPCGYVGEIKDDNFFAERLWQQDGIAYQSVYFLQSNSGEIWVTRERCTSSQDFPKIFRRTERHPGGLRITRFRFVRDISLTGLSKPAASAQSPAAWALRSARMLMIPTASYQIGSSPLLRQSQLPRLLAPLLCVAATIAAFPAHAAPPAPTISTTRRARSAPNAAHQFPRHPKLRAERDVQPGQSAS